MARSQFRPGAENAISKHRLWRYSSVGWKAIHYFAGFFSAALAAIVAVNAKLSFLDTTVAMILAAMSAGLSFLVTTMRAQERAKALDEAAWELEKAIAIYITDPAVPLSELGKAEARGIDILKSSDVH